jgi:NDP-sugar pyrophosphorylase family protein
VTIEAPCFIDEDVVIKKGARIGPYAVIGRHCHIGEGAVVDGAILWPNTWVDSDAKLVGTIAGRHSHFGRSVEIGATAIFGDKSVVTDYSKA